MSDRFVCGSPGRRQKMLALPPGSHEIILQRDGWVESKITVEAERGERVEENVPNQGFHRGQRIC